MFSSIRIRLTFSHLAVIILAMGLSGFLLLSFLESYFLQAAEDSLMAQAHITTQVLIPGTVIEGPPVESAPAYNTIQQQQVSNLNVQADNLLLPTDTLSLGNLDLTYLADASLQLGAQLDTHIRILDAQGLVRLDSAQTETGVDLRDNPLVTQALTGQQASRTRQVGDVLVMEVVLPATIEEQLVGVVYLSQPLSDVTAVLQDLRALLALATAITLVFSGVAGLLLSQAITRPLRRLTVAAGAVAQGDLDQEVPIRSQDELGRLGQVFNNMTARLRDARQMQIDFVANVSHELRTPLTSVKGLVETLRGGAVDDLAVRDTFLETIETETDRHIRLVSDLLLLSRVDSDALVLHCEPVDLADLIQTVVNQFVPQAGQKLVLDLETDPDALDAFADADRVAQVLVNLLDNACKYSPPNGTITVSVNTDPDNAISVHVRDEGIGIAATDLPHIGQRFYRADKARSRDQGGSGLGLAIAQALIQAQGGGLWVESQEEVGTVVSFTLPSPQHLPVRSVDSL